MIFSNLSFNGSLLFGRKVHRSSFVELMVAGHLDWVLALPLRSSAAEQHCVFCLVVGPRLTLGVNPQTHNRWAGNTDQVEASVLLVNSHFQDLAL